MKKRNILIIVILFLNVFCFAQTRTDYSYEWAVFSKTLSDNLSFDIRNDKFEILVLGNENLVAEINKMKKERILFGGKQVNVKNTYISDYGYQPYIIYVDKSVPLKQMLKLKTKYPRSLIMTNHHDYKGTYIGVSKVISVFYYGAHVRSLGNPLTSFEMSRQNFSKSMIMMSVDIQSLFGSY